MTHYKIVNVPSTADELSETPFDADTIADAKLVVTSRRLPVTSKGLPVPGRLLDAETGEEVMSWATLEDLPPLV